MSIKRVCPKCGYKIRARKPIGGDGTALIITLHRIEKRVCDGSGETVDV